MRVCSGEKTAGLNPNPAKIIPITSPFLLNKKILN